MNYNLNHSRQITNLSNRNYNAYYMMRLKQKPTSAQKEFIDHLTKLLKENNVEPVALANGDRYQHTIVIKQLLWQCKQNNINTKYNN